MSDHTYLREAQRAASRLESHDDIRLGLMAERDEAIRHAHEVEGATIAELSRATGLTRTMLYKIIEKGHATG